jgi:hypothetical protein
LNILITGKRWRKAVKCAILGPDDESREALLQGARTSLIPIYFKTNPISLT